MRQKNLSKAHIACAVGFVVNVNFYSLEVRPMNVFRSLVIITNCQSAEEEELLGKEMIAGKLRAQQVRRRSK